MPQQLMQLKALYIKVLKSHKPLQIAEWLKLPIYLQVKIMRPALTISHLESVISDDKLRLILEHNFKHLKVGQKAKMRVLGSDNIFHTISFSRSK